MVKVFGRVRPILEQGVEDDLIKDERDNDNGTDRVINMMDVYYWKGGTYRVATINQMRSNSGL